MMYRESNIGSIALAFAIGGLIGAGAMMLMAPHSGKETRKLIRSKSMELKDRAVDTAESTRKQASKRIDDLSSTTREKANHLRDRGQEMIARGKEKASEATDALRRS